VTQPTEFYRGALRALGHERVIRASKYGKPAIEVALLREGEERGGLSIYPDGLAVVATALGLARDEVVSEHVGEIRNGRFWICVKTTRRVPDGAVIVFARHDENGAEAGRPVALSGREIDGLAKAATWLAGTTP
jgi:hypothetical protein